MSDQELKNLFVDEESIGKELLHKLLLPFVKIGQKTLEVYLTDAGERLDVSSKILLYLLVQKALRALSKVESDGLKRAEIVEKTGINKNTVGVALMRLKKAGLATKREGLYFIAPGNLHKLETRLLSKTSG